MKTLKSRYNYDPSMPLSKQYQDAEVFNAYYKCYDTQKNQHFLLSHFKTQNKTQVLSLFKKFSNIKDRVQESINSKYLTRIHDAFVQNKQKSLFLVLDYCQGGGIIDYIGKVYTLDWKLAIRVICGVLQGLLELHKFDIVNCFINLQNIQIDQHGNPRLSFKCMIYKTIYLSPQFRKDHVKSKQGDLYCLGACLYRLIYGVFPFKTQKNQELLQLVQRGPQLSCQKGQGLFPIISPDFIGQIIKDLLNIQPQLRLNAIPKIQQHSQSLMHSAVLPPQIYNKLFKHKYINILTCTDQTDEHEYTVLQKNQKKLLKLSIYNSKGIQIQNYIKSVITRFAQISAQYFLKIYEYQILQEDYLVLVYSYCGQGNLLQYRKSLQSAQGFGTRLIQTSVQSLKNSIRLLGIPYKYLTNDKIYIKSGLLRLKFPDLPTWRFLQNLKKLSSSSEPHFIAPQILDGKQSRGCDSWSLAVIQYWMIFNQMPKFDSKGTLVISNRPKLSKHKQLYFYHTIQKNPDRRLNVLNQKEMESRLKIVESISLINQQANEPGSPNRKSKIRRISQQNNLFPTMQQKPHDKTKRHRNIRSDHSANSNILPNKIEYQKSQLASRYKSPIIIQSKLPLTPKNGNKFNHRIFEDASQIKTPEEVVKAKEKKSRNTEQKDDVPLLEQMSSFAYQSASKLRLLQESNTRAVRILIKCIIASLLYLFLFYFNFFRVNGALMGGINTYQTKTVQIRAFSSDTTPNVNYTLVTKTPVQTHKLLYNATLFVLREQYKCVLNDHSVESNVAQIIKSSAFSAYQVFGLIIAISNLVITCVVIARLDLCKVLSLTNFEQRKYNALTNYCLVNLAIITLTSFHYLIYGGLYHILLEPCLGKSTLPGLQLIFKSWTDSWAFRFIWIYIGILMAYAVIIFFLNRPIQNVNKYLYVTLIVLYFAGVGLRGIGNTYPAHQNVFGLCGQLLALIVGVFLLLTDAVFMYLHKPKIQAQKSVQNDLNTISIQDFNRTEEFFFGNAEDQEESNQK